MAEQDQSGEKEFAATEERLRQAREDGDVPVSKEANAAGLIIGIGLGTLVFLMLTSRALNDGFAGMFWKATPRSNWPQDEQWLQSIQENWVEPFGDMRQELVFIGQNLDQEKITRALDACLLSEDEVLRGKEYWYSLEDPFPEWQAA